MTGEHAAPEMGAPSHDSAPGPDDEGIGGVHIKYLAHCPRQLWLYARGYRPERDNAAVTFGESVDETTYTRRRDIDLGEAKIDWITTGAVIHETKSARTPSPQHEAQVRHYCLLLERRGINVRGGVVHYPLTRRTVEVPWNGAARAQAEAAEQQARQVIAAESPPPRLARQLCRACSYADYCWGDR